MTDGSNYRTEQCHLLNVIPNQKAPKLLFEAGLIDTANNKLWAGVHVDTYQSLFDPDIYVIGDAHDSNQPKAGHIANSEAKVCADALLRNLGLRPPRVMPDEAPVTNSACYSPITASKASFLTTGFRYDMNADKMVRVDASFGEAETINSDNYKMMLAWANNLFAEVFLNVRRGQLYSLTAPTLRRGNGALAAPAALHHPTLERRELHSHAGAWERSVTYCFCITVAFFSLN
ncbi:FCSD flavin-binding domain-containing protein [Methylocucumis oryzae]|uniref:FCSD flavin-binding domain-containing protein n=1 Tax=Methylocucumis oryzae TaxID=1632867 RepID=UPI000696203F|nr:FCSD flavin-binding domain-containing protein [Methylocucumis oryzae]